MAPAVLAVLAFGFLAPSAGARTGKGDPVTRPQRVVGVTVTDTARIIPTVQAIRHLGVPVTSRLVLDPGPVGHYAVPARRLARAGRVMTEPVDSFGMSTANLDQYRQRFTTAVNQLGRWTDVWEVGNEVNGAWTGPPREVAAKVTAALDVVRAGKARSALTLYYNRGCKSYPWELDPLVWSKRMLPAPVRRQFNFVYFSYYETECENRRPSRGEWKRQFRKLHRLYPKARLGFGEVGLPEPVTAATDLKAREIINRYYRMKFKLPYYIGGGFWWNFAQDMVPWGTSPLFQSLRQAVRR
ncbi:MAG: hypothetical protein M9938_11235 [Solirubrobacterales bacterium]|nr:hypothetical protein [Solirubrobacterales bacterium]